MARKTLAQRLEERTDKNGPVLRPELGPCWPWTGGRFRAGYGRLKIAGSDRLAHRLVWEEANGPIPEGLCVCHHCDNPPCVRIDHLFVDTVAGNNRDRDAKGRQASGDRNAARLYPEKRPRGDGNGSRRRPERLKRGAEHPLRIAPERAVRGERHGMSKLTADAVRTIRSTDDGVESLALRFGVSVSAIHGVRYRRTWKHLLP